MREGGKKKITSRWKTLCATGLRRAVTDINEKELDSFRIASKTTYIE